MNKARFVGWAILWFASAGVLAGEGSDRDAEEFFELRVRPLLTTHCMTCHGPAKQAAGLRLDSRAAVLKGGESGPAALLDDPENSRLIKAVNHHDGLAMPPDQKLGDEQIADLLHWIELGLPWPAAAVARNVGDDRSASLAAQSHWAFQPLAAPAVPVLEGTAVAGNEIDRFILARLASAKLAPVVAADRRTLIRRATFDLHGLPPTPDEVDAFVGDGSPDAYSRLIDRLLDSPRYGERWARHWLDLARYADTKGYTFGESPEYPFAWTYRDWVVRSLNEDLPYDQFLVRQIAADQLPLGSDQRSLAALGFLALGRWFLASEPDQIDDRLDVIFRTTMGLSISCARCHDHKYDPIPTADYYSLYGLLVGAQKAEVPIPGSDAESQAYADHAAELAAREQAVAAFLAESRTRLVDPVRGRIGDYLLAAQAALKAAETPMTDSASTEGQSQGGETPQDPPAVAAPPVSDSPPLTPFFVERWQNQLSGTRGAFHPVFGPWHAFAALTPETFSTEGLPLAEKFAANQDAAATLNPLVAKLFTGPAPRTLPEVAARYDGLLKRIEELWQRELREAAEEGLPAPAAFSQPAREELRNLLYGDAAPASASDGELRTLLSAEEQTRIGELDANVAAWKAKAPPLATVMRDGGDPGDPVIFLRGNPATPGGQVPRRFLRLVGDAERTAIPHLTGRREIAKAIVDPRNPLTARVIVNRSWAHHFGRGLVETPSDFGTQGAPPTHPELLDFLATRLIAEGWSLKSLHRLIMNSAAYCRSSGGDPAQAAIDPENRLLWRMNRRGLEFEAIRDSLLQVAAGFDETMGGPPVNITEQPTSRRRTLYVRIDRQEMPAELRTFDVADPDMHQPKRHATIVPQQALYLLNSPFAAEQSRALGQRLEQSELADRSERITWLYREVLGRAPSEQERTLAGEFLDAASEPPAATGTAAWQDAATGPGPPPQVTPLSAWGQLCQVLLLSNEFVSID